MSTESPQKKGSDVTLGSTHRIMDELYKLTFQKSWEADDLKEMKKVTVRDEEPGDS